MAMEREIPYCSIALVLGAIACHSAVLWGNLQTAGMFSGIGHSTNGWSDVGLKLSHSLKKDLDNTLLTVTNQLTQTIVEIGEVQTAIDAVLGKAGEGADNATALLLAHVSSKHKGLVLTDLSAVAVVQNPVENPAVASVIASLRNGTVAPTMEALKGLADLLPDNMSASDITAVITEFAKEIIGQYNVSKAAVKSALHDAVEVVVEKVARAVKQKVRKFWRAIEPALLQVSVWLETFGTAIQSTMETFSVTIDTVQKLLDSVMAQTADVGKGADQMMYDTFTLFDVSGSGGITVQDLRDVSELYGIEALAGEKAQQLHDTYDEDGSKELDETEYANLVGDESVPLVMASVLRAYAERLSVIAGNVAAAKLRDEVASAVCKYFTLVCSKNKTKVDWVSNRLTNGSVPKEFTADVLKNLAMDLDNPDKLTKEDVGQVVVNAMYRMEPDYVEDVADLMGRPDFWASEGFSPHDQPVVVERVGHWIAEASKGSARGQKAALLQRFSGNALSLLDIGVNQSDEASLQAGLAAMPKRMRASAELRGAARRAELRRARAKRLSVCYGSAGARHLRSVLLGGVAASARADDPLAEQAVNSGQPAAPETLEFAKFLSWNASQQADVFQNQTFEYSGTSSGPIDSFANKIQAMVKRIQTFLGTMEEYSTPTAINRTREEVFSFADNFASSVSATIDERVLSQVDDLIDEYYPDQASRKAARAGARQQSLLQKPGRGLPGAADASDQVAAVTEKVRVLLTNLQEALPTVTKNLKDARTTVSAVSETLRSVFTIFQTKGPAIFYQVAEVYKTLWVAYFVLFATITLALLGYGFWASGFCDSGEGGAASSDYQRPSSFWEKICCCCSTCGACCRGCHDSNTCFWSVVILMEVISLILFIVAVALCLLSGIQAFLGAGCSQVYIIGDAGICGGSLNVVQKFLSSFFHGSGGSMENLCDEKTLLTCKVINDRLGTSTMAIIVGSILASVLTFQMIVESSIMHERARWRKFDPESTKDA